MAPPGEREPNATGGGFLNPGGTIPGMGPRASVSSTADIQIPKVDSLRNSIKSLRSEITELQKVMAAFTQSGVSKKMAADYAAIAKSGTAAAQAVAAESKSVGGRATGGGFGGTQPTIWQTRDRKDPAATVKVPTVSTSAGSGGAGSGSGGGLPPSPGPRAFGFNKGTSPSTGDVAGGIALGTGVGNAVHDLTANATGQNGLLAAVTAIPTALEQVWGALAGGSMQYAYNRINGPTGNMNAMLQLSQALAPNVTMMNAAGKNIDMHGMVQGLGQRMPVMGTQQDMLSTILAGQSVGALMSGTPGRNGFFESTRQAQALIPGQAPGQIAGNIAGYIGNVKAQQMGAMMGEGAFTMIGQGGRYKTLAEWAHGITQFLEQHRPGGQQGKGFTKAELITQNFPGSNLNAWFQFMGVPQSMVDYWWQYVLTDKGGVAPDKITSDLLQQDVQKTRGINLGYEQLRTATQATRRDYLMGSQMYGMYAANASANRRFNVAMQGTDQALAATMQGTNIGRMIALLPTPIMEMLMPILTQVLSSPVGAAASAVGGLTNVGDPGAMPYGALPSTGWGEAGGTTTAHLSPDLAKRVQTMMSANPELKISSGYRDTNTQNRLRRNGAQAVGHPSKSAHTRGWAVDIGPASQMGWLMQNSGKFGLQTASNYGEPWHIQRAGTPLVGDPGSRMPYGGLGDVFGSIGNAITDPAGTLTDLLGIPNPFDLGGMIGDIAQGVFSALKDFMVGVMKELQKPLEDALNKFIGGGTYSQMIDKATASFSQLMTAPLRGAMNLGGKASGGAADLQALINQPADIPVPVVMGSGFTSRKPTGPIFGDPMPFGGPLTMMTNTPTASPTQTVVLHINAPITIKADMKTGSDARRMASTLLDHLEEQATQREWLST